MVVLGAEAAPQPGVVEFSPAGGTFSNFVVVELPSSNALVRYTLAGSDPTENSAGYYVPLLLTESTLVKARTFPRKQAPGAIFSHTYVIVQEEIGEFLRRKNGEARRQFQDEAALPVVIIDTFGQPIDMVEAVSGTNRVRVKDRVKAHVTVTKVEERMPNDEPIRPHPGPGEFCLSPRLRPQPQERDDSGASELHASKAEGQRLKAKVVEGSRPHPGPDDQGAGGTTPSRVEYDGWAEVSVRGGSSAAHLKKPFKLELQDENGADVKASLLGMPKESDWILYPSHRDKTFVRDSLAYELWKEMGTTRRGGGMSKYFVVDGFKG